MNTKSILFVGCGDLGRRSGAMLLEKGWQVAGVRRDPSRLPAGFLGFAGDYTRAGSLDFIEELRPAYIVATCNPAGRSVEGYRRGFTDGARNLLAGLGDHRPRGILWVSSTRVYAERNGGWVDEESATAEDDSRAVAMVAAERILLESVQRACVVRFAGIYGPPGGRLLDRIRRGEWVPQRPVRFSNRIHRDDAAGFLCHLLGQLGRGAALAPIYNGVDDEPAAQFEVDAWLAARTGAAGEPPATPDQPGVEVREAFVRGHKRCSNRLLRSSGYDLIYPDYRCGYAAVLAGNS